MTKRSNRISDAAVFAIEADLSRLNAEYNRIEDHDDPDVQGRINAIFRQMSALEEKALRRPPATVEGLASQGRIVGRVITCDSLVRKLVANIEALSSEPAPKAELRLRHGKRYRDRKGNVTAPMDQMDSRGLFFGDNESGSMFEVDGRHIGWDRTEDLVEEVIPERRSKKQLTTGTQSLDQFTSQESIAA
ncbi:hypothetical protein LMIY3S_03662 [Labrys miyagiensis]